MLMCRQHAHGLCLCARFGFTFDWLVPTCTGWTQKETEVLRLSLMKHGVGNWKVIIHERVLPGKTLAQLVCQTQKLLGQQSLKGLLRCGRRAVT